MESKESVISKDPNWLRHVAQIEVMIETHRLCNFMGAVLTALENIEISHISECQEFEESQHHKNIEHQKKVIELAMGAVDLNSMYGNAEARRIALERFKHNIEEALEHHG